MQAMGEVLRSELSVDSCEAQLPDLLAIHIAPQTQTNIT